MPSNPWLGLVFHWTGGLSAASCYLPFRGIRRWSWEIYWILQGCVCWIIAPAIFSLVLVPGTQDVIHAASRSTLITTWFWGTMWGIGGLLFGLGVRYLGIALGYTVALGFSTAFGTLMPPLFAGQLGAISHDRSGQWTLAGVAVCLGAIALTGFAGKLKENELVRAKRAGSVAHAEEGASPGGEGEYRAIRGFLVASFAGIMGACLAYGLTAGKPMTDHARTLLIAHGRSDMWQSLPTLIVVLWGGWTTNALWCGGLLIKNRSARQFLGSGEGAAQTARNYLFAGCAGLLWYLQFFFYSMGQSRMGRYEFSSWTLHMAGTIVFATLWGTVLHEWKGASTRTKWLGGVGFALLVLSTVLVGYGNSLKPS